MLPYMLLFVVISFFSLLKADSKCSWNNCPVFKSDRLNVHLICHTHDDMGWIKTVDQYYYGSEKHLVTVGVQYILDSVVEQLEIDANRRFSFAETGFLWRWMTNRKEIMNQRIKKLVQKGQLELIGGGWTQNDEAATHYVSIIDQISFGLRYLNWTFGDCGRPKIAWQIDPFGHSREQASIFAQIGYKALYFSRINYLEKNARLANKSLDFIWNGSDDLDRKIRTTVFYLDSYGPPEGFCFDSLCADDPIMDDPRFEEYNVDEKVRQFIEFVKKQASFQQQKSHVLILMGSDFQYENAAIWYRNLDKLIKYVNEKQTMEKVNVFYSTPSCYTKAVETIEHNLPTKNDDFFPYASGNHSFWTGYFTSRPSLKGFIRESSSLLQLNNWMQMRAFLRKITIASIFLLLIMFHLTEKAVALAQHHDAITGTARENVTRDYEKRLFKGWMKAEKTINDAMKKLIPKQKDANSVPELKLCPLLNISVCNVTRSGAFTVTVFNGQAWASNTIIGIPYYYRVAFIFDPNGTEIQGQIVKTFSPKSQLPYANSVPYQLFFPIKVGPLGFATYFVHNQSINGYSFDNLVEEIVLKNQKTRRRNKFRSTTLENGLIRLFFDSHGLISKYTDLLSNKTWHLRQQFFWYKGVGITIPKSQPSGAYIFRPSKNHPSRVANSADIRKTTGPLVSEIRQTFSPWISQIVRLYRGKPYVELEWIIGPIPKEKISPTTKEIISRFRTNIDNKDRFFTDSNGRQMMLRIRNRAPMYTYEDTEPVSGNYYPVPSRIHIEDDNAVLTILTDRSQGGSSLSNGQIELMIHRRCFHDDHFGVDQSLNEPGIDGRGLVVKGRHWLILTDMKQSTKIHRRLASDLYSRPILTFSSYSGDINLYRARFITEFSGLRYALPSNINILTLEPWNNGGILLRLEHILPGNLSTSISLNKLFAKFDITSISELNLGANKEIRGSEEFDDAFTVTLKPMEIKTFYLVVNRDNADNRDQLMNEFIFP